MNASDVGILDRQQVGAVNADSLSCEVFDFEHKVFQLKPCTFSRAPGDSRIITTLILEGLVVRVPISAIKKHFSIDDGSKDDQLLAKVVRALQYVREVRPGDTIPTEVLDGRASWLVDPRFRELAQAKLELSLVDGFNGGPALVVAASDAVAMVQASEFKQKIEVARAESARLIGIPPERVDDINDTLSQLAGEISYIEALRERFAIAKRILWQLRQIRSPDRYGRQATEDAARIVALLQRPVEQLVQRFKDIDAKLGRTHQLLKSPVPSINFIRKSRDDLRQVYLNWEEILVMWENVAPEDDEALQVAMRQTYRFAANRFPQTARW